MAVKKTTRSTAKKPKTGRPKLTVEWTEFEKLCAIMCTKEEICDWFRLSDSTLSRHIKTKYNDTFEGIYKKLTVPGKISLRRAQFQAATVRGNTAMLIWLGKQYLGQTEKIETSVNNKGKILDAIEKMCE